MSEVLYVDRSELGRRLADRLRDLRDEQPVILATSRASLQLASVIAEHLLGPLELLVVDPIVDPDDPIATIGAVAEDGSYRYDERAAARAGLGPAQLRALGEEGAQRAARHARACREGRRLTDVRGRPVVIVEERTEHWCVLATAVAVVAASSPSAVLVAVPIASPAAVAQLHRAGHGVVSLAIGSARADARERERDEFDDERCADILRRHGAGGILLGCGDDAAVPASDVRLALPSGVIDARLRLPLGASSGVVLADGWINGRRDDEQDLPARLARAGEATLAIASSDRSPDRTEVDLLARQIDEVTAWLREHLGLGPIPVAYVGEGLTAAAMLRTTARHHATRVRGLVARSAPLDLVADDLPEVEAPTLLLVDARDDEAVLTNRRAASLLGCAHRIEVVPGSDGALVRTRMDVLTLRWVHDHLHPGHAPETRRRRRSPRQNTSGEK